MIISKYITLIKPKIILGNILSVTGGFLVASQGTINYELLFKTLVGTSLIIASNCILNNIIEQPLDLLMERTKNRALVLKLIKPIYVFTYAMIFFVVGFIILFYETNLPVIYLAITSSVIYIGLYTTWIKKKSIYSTLIGSLSGASPPAIGYCTVTNHFDMGALILIILFIVWQIPHFYSIAIFRLTDYQSARIPTYPSKKGYTKTKQHIIFCIIIFMINILILVYNHYASYIFLLPMEILSGYWLYTAFNGNTKNISNNKIVLIWAKKMFILSIVTITFFNVAISIDSIYH